MLLRWDVQEPNCVLAKPTALPTWHGVGFMESYTLPSYKTGLSSDNDEYRNPRAILKTLKRIDEAVPNKLEGQIWVNGLGNKL